MIRLALLALLSCLFWWRRAETTQWVLMHTSTGRMLLYNEYASGWNSCSAEKS